MFNTDEHHNESYEDGEPRTSSVAAIAYPEWQGTEARPTACERIRALRGDADSI